MGIFVLVVVIVVVVLATKRVMSGFVCPFCDGEIRRAFEMMECTGCGRTFPMWQARRRKPR